MPRLKMLAVLLSSALTTACANTTGTEGTAAQVCRSWGEIRPSRKDVLTPDTARQITGNNAAHEAWCPPSKAQKVAAKT